MVNHLNTDHWDTWTEKIIELQQEIDNLEWEGNLALADALKIQLRDMKDIREREGDWIPPF